MVINKKIKDLTDQEIDVICRHYDDHNACTSCPLYIKADSCKTHDPYINDFGDEKVFFATEDALKNQGNYRKVLKGMNSIEFLKEEYTKDVLEDLIGHQIRILLAAGYECKIFDDGLTIAIEFDFYDKQLADEKLHWITEDEWYMILDQRKQEDGGNLDPDATLDDFANDGSL